MSALSKNWITEKHIDFEYKKYLLLAYLSEVNSHFGKNMLYPYFSELMEHYKNITSLKKNKRFFEDAFPVKVNKIDIKNLNMEYERLVQDDALMQELEQIIDYSIPKFEHYLNEGKKIFDFIEDQIFISPVGLIPLNPSWGYLFLSNGENRETCVYEYQVTLFENAEEKYRGLHTHFVDSYKKNFTTTYEHIKSDLIQRKRDMPNPAAYAIETDLKLPLNETFLPVAKRIFMKHLSEMEAGN